MVGGAGRCVDFFGVLGGCEREREREREREEEEEEEENREMRRREICDILFHCIVYIILMNYMLK